MREKIKYAFFAITIIGLVFLFGSVNKSEEKAFNLDGEWDFYDEMLLYPSDFNSNELPDSQLINIPSNFMSSILNSSDIKSYGTIKKDFYLYDFKDDEILTIKNGLFRENCKIWINGELIIDNGDIFTNKVESKYINSTSFGEFKINGKKIEVVIQFSKFNYYNFSSSVISVTKLSDLIKSYTRSVGMDLFMLGSVLILCIYHLVFYFRSKTFGNRTGALYFALLFLMIALRIINIGDYFILELFQQVSFEVINKIAFWSFYLLLPLLILFNNEIFPGFYNKKYITINKYILYVFMVIVLLLDFTWYFKLIIPYILYLLISVVYTIKVYIYSNSKCDSMGRLSYLGFIIAIFALISDLAYITNIYRERHFAYIGTFVFMAVISTFVSNRYNDLFTKVEVLSGENKLYVDEIKKNNQTLERKIEHRTQELTEAFNMLEIYSKEIRKILDNTGQGFMTIDESITISGEFSKECYKIFGEDIKNIDISKKLFPYNIEQKLFFETIIKKIYLTDEKNQAELYMSLLPIESNIRGRLYSINYKLISSKSKIDNIMLILTDITERKELELDMINEQNLLNMIVSVVMYYDDFLSLISGYMTFCKVEISEIMTCKSAFEDKLFRILKEIHTYKGLFHRFGMLSTVSYLHSLETELFEIQDDIKAYTPRSVLKLISSYDINSYTDKDMLTLKEKLGKNFLNDNNYLKIHKDRIDDLIEEAKQSNCSKKMIGKVKKLKLVSFKKLLSLYPELITDISQDMGKQVLKMKIKGDDFEVDSKKYERVIKSLVHVYKNAVSHGIEFEDERTSKGKKAYGCIETKIENDENIRIIIEDDGAGISIESVKQRLMDKYGYSEDYFVPKTDNEILKMIFKTGYTSLDTESIVSGRGVGLSSFIDEVEKIAGTVNIETEIDKYTRIIIELPRVDAEENSVLEKNNFIKAICKSTSDLISRYLGTSLVALNSNSRKVDSSKMKMFKYSSYMEIHGDIESRLLFTFDDGALTWIKKVLDLDGDEEDLEMIEDSIAEITNIILGNSASLISESSSNVVVGMPVVINDISSMNLSRFDVHEFSIDDVDFNMKVYMVFNKE